MPSATVTGSRTSLSWLTTREHGLSGQIVGHCEIGAGPIDELPQLKIPCFVVNAEEETPIVELPFVLAGGHGQPVANDMDVPEPADHPKEGRDE